MPVAEPDEGQPDKRQVTIFHSSRPAKRLACYQAS